MLFKKSTLNDYYVFHKHLSNHVDIAIEYQESVLLHLKQLCMAEDIETTLQLRRATRRVDFENRLHRYINKHSFIQDWVYENIVP